MKKCLTIFCLALIVFSCSKKINNREVENSNKQEKIVCNKFNIETEINDDKLTLKIYTDLPDEAQVIVRIGRSYWINEDTCEYSIDYFEEEESIKKWKSKRIYTINNELWKEKLQKKIDNMSALGSMYAISVSEVNEDIFIIATVSAKQPNNIFGEKNNKLEGSAVSKSGSYRFISKKVYVKKSISNYKIRKNVNSVINNKFADKDFGKWRDPFFNATIKIFQKKGVIHVDTYWQDGSISHQTVVRTTGTGEYKRYYVSDSGSNEYFIFRENGNLDWFDDEGLYGSLKRSK